MRCQIFAFLLIVLVVFLDFLRQCRFVFGTLFALMGWELGPGGTGASLLAVISGIVSAAGTIIFTSDAGHHLPPAYRR